MTKGIFIRSIIIGLLLLLVFPGIARGTDDKSQPASMEEVEAEITELMEDGDIPGLSLVVVREGQPIYIKSFGYADLEKQTKVTPETLFELASTSKAFTALAAVKLEQEGLLDLDKPVSHYLEDFYTVFEGEKQTTTLRQVLHQTSGIPDSTVGLIPESKADNALQETVKKLHGQELEHIPGTAFKYATINYDIIGATIEKVTGMSYEDYISKHILNPLGMNATQIGRNPDYPNMATGYKIGFNQPRAYDAPVYRGNNPAGYVVSNAADMARWLQFQMGLLENPELYPMAQKTQSQDQSVIPISNLGSYGMGWFNNQFGVKLISHGGDNPNFKAWIGFKPEEKVGVVVLANSDSIYVPHLGPLVMNMLKVGSYNDRFRDEKGIDGTTSAATYAIGVYILLVLIFIISIFLDIFKGKRSFVGISLKKFLMLIGTLVAFIPFIIGIYLVPSALRNIPWEIAMVWTPISFKMAAYMLMAAMGASFIANVFSTLFPMRDKYMKSVPLVLVLSLLSGAANAMVIFLISSSLYSGMELIYQVYFYGLAFFIYILGRRIIQVRLTEITYTVVLDMRMKLADKIFRTTYQLFEKMDRGRVYATLNDDTAQISMAANVFVGLVTSMITTICVFAYLMTIAFWATAITLGVVIFVAILYSYMSKKAEQLMEEARDTRNVFMGLLNGMLDGFKELSLHMNKKKEYRQDIKDTSSEFADKMTGATVRFIDAFMIGESMLLVVLGAVCFAIPKIFPEISTPTLMSFIMALLYLIGPVNVILRSIPQLVQIRISWNRVKSFEREIPASIAAAMLKNPQPVNKDVTAIKASNVIYQYPTKDEKEDGFTVGPIDFEARKGEITFIIGANGSGKTTFAKLLTGLYHPQEGTIEVEGENAENNRLGEYFSTVYSNFHLFDKLYDVDIDAIQDKAKIYIERLDLQDKVKLEDKGYSTIDLSGGQKKRLALLRCYLEDSPVYLFDEVAADQDPEFRKFFYRELLQDMKKQGKIVIAITHDDHYFDVADKIIKLDMGKLDTVDASYRTTAAETVIEA